MERQENTAATLIARDGLGAVTLEAVAAAADCSPTSLHAVFGNRDGPVLHDALGDALPPVDEVTRTFAETFIRATAQ